MRYDQGFDGARLAEQGVADPRGYDREHVIALQPQIENNGLSVPECREVGSVNHVCYRA